MLNRLYEPMFLSLSYAPPKLCKLPLKIFSPFLTGMAKGLEQVELWIWTMVYGQVLNLRRQCSDLSLDVRKLGRYVLHMGV